MIIPTNIWSTANVVKPVQTDTTANDVKPAQTDTTQIWKPGYVDQLF